MKRELAPRTKKKYQQILLSAFGDAGPTQERIAALGWPESRFAILRAALLDAQERSGDDFSETVRAIPSRYVVKRERAVPVEAEVARFESSLHVVKPHWRHAIKVLLALGLRAEEFLMLPRERIERGLETGVLVVLRKGGKEATLPLSGEVKGHLRFLLSRPARATNGSADGGYAWEEVKQIFTGGSFETSYNLLLRAVKKVAGAANLDLDLWSPHTLRHIFASRMIRKGAPLPVVQRALGHASYATTALYIHTETGDLAKFMG